MCYLYQQPARLYHLLPEQGVEDVVQVDGEDVQESCNQSNISKATSNCANQ